jgi:NADH-quinone oxidoreductase subunit G
MAGEGGFLGKLKAAKRPLIIVGQGALTGTNGAAILSAAAKLSLDVGAIADDWMGLSILHTAASRVGGLDIGFVPGEGRFSARDVVKAGERLEMLFLLGADEIDVPPGPFVVYLGTHGDAGAHRADVILPGAAYTEKPGTYVNTEGRVQASARAVFPPGDAREDWSILRALSGVLDQPLPFDNFRQLRARLYQDFPHMAEIDAIRPAERADFERLAAHDGSLAGPAFKSPIRDFYLTNPIARASRVLAECSALHLGPVSEAAE